MKHILNKLFSYQSLDKAEASEILTQLASGAYNNSQIAAFMTVFLMRNITVDELTGFRDAMLELCVKVPAQDYNAIDLCGTGGDGKDTFNISTLASFVVAGAGYMVAKHGNYGVSSVCGSSNVLEYVGCRFTNDIGQIMKSFDQSNFAFYARPFVSSCDEECSANPKRVGSKNFFQYVGAHGKSSLPSQSNGGGFQFGIGTIIWLLISKYG